MGFRNVQIVVHPESEGGTQKWRTNEVITVRAVANWPGALTTGNLLAGGKRFRGTFNEMF